ncbi:WD40-repeat-containing domain protein [Dunaliella salina]|uniref:WD40-repeat-containing domain protein n=1 Tax=Dunaliella salina TaxID=3046 RepID=A0ABQ7G4E0_DUNSA|nr:WD40-repeat-containing domain protein [Dunaliella salina]|eukprot:KAF5829449.1 WD40-repeat-containing domain protein [Dunaliella salina]
MDFHRTEDMLVTASDDDSIHVYNTASGMLTETVYSKKYGVSNICSTHSQYCVMYATRKPPANANDLSWYSLRYHDIRRNEYVRYFRGHTGPLNTLAMSPKNDVFMSASQDKTVRLWDMRTNLCQGLMQAPGNPCASFDQQAGAGDCRVGGSWSASSSWTSYSRLNLTYCNNVPGVTRALCPQLCYAALHACSAELSGPDQHAGMVHALKLYPLPLLASIHFASILNLSLAMSSSSL